jgi:hypothetical protein
MDHSTVECAQPRVSVPHMEGNYVRMSFNFVGQTTSWLVLCYEGAGGSAALGRSLFYVTEKRCGVVRGRVVSDDCDTR